MSGEMDIVVEMQEESRKDSTEEMELESESSTRSEKNSMSEKSNSGYDVTDSSPSDPKNFQQNISLKIDIAEGNYSQTFNSRIAEPETSGLENSAATRETADCKHSPPVLVNTQSFQQNLSDTSDSPFQKPVCRTHSLGAGDPSPFTIRRRPARLAFQSQLQSPSAFKRKLRMPSPIRCDILDEMEDSVLKRCNSAPMLYDINDTDARVYWHHGSITPGSIRARRFSATVIPVNSPSAGSSKSTSRLAQLKKEESLQGIQHKETAHEREVQTSIQMNHTCEELSLSDGLSGAPSGSGDGPGLMPQVTVAPPSAERPPRSPLPSSVPVSVPVPNKQCPSRSIDFNLSSLQYHNQQGIPSPLTISTSPLCLSPLPPSPTRNLGFSSTGKQCFSPSMQVPVPACLRPGSISPSPSPTRRSFVTRRRSQSPCVLKPSVLGPIKRKYDSDSEGGSSPKRMFIPGSQPTTGNLQVEAFPQYSIVTPYFPRNYIHRSHSLSSGSIDSDITVSPSPSQAGVSIGFLPATHTLVLNPQSRDRNNGSPFQSPLQYTNSFSNTGGTHELGGCSSPASSTCSSSSLEGLKDLPPFPQSHLATHSSSNSSTPTLLKPLIKDRQSTVASSKSTTNVTS